MVVLWLYALLCCELEKCGVVNILLKVRELEKKPLYCLNLVMYPLEGVSDTCKIPCQSIFLPIYSPKHFLS